MQPSPCNFGEASHCPRPETAVARSQHGGRWPWEANCSASSSINVRTNSTYVGKLVKSAWAGGALAGLWTQRCIYGPATALIPSCLQLLELGWHSHKCERFCDNPASLAGLKCSSAWWFHRLSSLSRQASDCSERMRRCWWRRYHCGHDQLRGPGHGWHSHNVRLPPLRRRPWTRCLPQDGLFAKC